MKFVRLAIVHLDLAPDDFQPISGMFQDFRFSILGGWKIKNRLGFIIAMIKELDQYPELNDKKEIVPPDEIREIAERHIEVVTNIISVREGCKRELSSPGSTVALIPDNYQEKTWLAKTMGFARGDKKILRWKPYIDLTYEEVFKYLSDRIDGVFLLAEVLSHQHYTGQFHELVRFFERAFGLSPTKLIDPLSIYLSQTGQGYTHEEIENWLLRLRHPTTHADRRDYFFLEKDTRPVVWRMTQAAYDILLNKKNWREEDSNRLENWQAPAFTTDTENESLTIIEGRSARPQLIWLDDYGVFHWMFFRE